MRNRLVLIMVASILPGGIAFGEPQVAAGGVSDTLAEVGRRVITGKDLIERIELMPWPGKERPEAMDSIKRQALLSLAAEKIFSMEASAEGIGGDSAARRHLTNLEKLLVRDALYQREVKSAVTVTDEEVRRGLRRYASNVKVLMISAGSEDQARRMSDLLKSGAPLDSVLRTSQGASAPGTDTVLVKFGLLDQKQEDAVYGLSESSPASGPIRVDAPGWVVLYLLDKATNPEYAQRTILERKTEVGKKIRLRKEIDRADRYSAGLLSRFRAQARPAPFRLLAETLRGVFETKHLDGSSGGYRLGDVLDTVETILRTHLGDVLVDMPEGGMTIGDMLENVRVMDVKFASLDNNEFPLLVNKCIKDAVAREILSREGYRRHLEQSAEVEHDVGVWADYWRASALELRVVSGVTLTEGEVLDSLRAHIDVIGHDFQVNVREVLSDSLSAAMSVLNDVSRGARMTELARLSKRKEWAVRGGESGFFDIIEHPLIGLWAMEADTGMPVGPIKLPEGYSVFEVLGKRQSPGDSVSTFAALESAYREDLLAQKKQDALNRYVAEKCREYRVRLYYGRLRAVAIPPTNMVTRRFIGFGGSMLAVPALFPVWNWVKGAHTVEEVLP